MEKKQLSTLTVTLFIVVAALAITAAILRALSTDFGNLFLTPTISASGGTVPGGIVYEIIATLLTVATLVLYLLGGGVVFVGAMLSMVRFAKIKLKDPYQSSGVTRYLSGYLTLSLELFIGAEIIKTTTTQQLTDFEVLILIIVSRGLFSLILYLERRWHGTAETE
jgi:uncharacterized membrane protein